MDEAIANCALRTRMGCNGLNARYCLGGACKFAKTAEQLRAENERAVKRLTELGRIDQAADIIRVWLR